MVARPNSKRGLEDLDIVEMIERARKLLLEKGIPVFDEIKDAFRGIGHVNTYYGYRSAVHE